MRFSIYLFDQLRYSPTLLFGYLAQALPKFVFQRHARCIPIHRYRPFDYGCHNRCKMPATRGALRAVCYFFSVAELLVSFFFFFLLRRSVRRSWRSPRRSSRRSIPCVCASASVAVSIIAGTARLTAAAKPRSEKTLRRDSGSNFILSLITTSYPFGFCLPWVLECRLSALI